MRKYDKESRANKRLSMNYEEVMWRMSQSSEFGSSESLTKRQVSHSPPRSETGSPDPRRRHLSPSNADVTMRHKRRSGDRNIPADSERKLRTRSATFVLEKNESLSGEVGSGSPCSSPRMKQKRWKTTSTCEEPEVNRLEVGNDVRMCSSTGPEMLYAQLNRQEALMEENDHSFTGTNMVASGDMTGSYARSVSGVSDSGMYSGNYDSMTRSEMLNSSIISTDSEFVASTNASLMLDSTNDDGEVESSIIQTEQENEKTLLQANSNSSSSLLSPAKTSHGDDCGAYKFDISLPVVGSPRDNVFEESESVSGSASMGSSSVSLDGFSDRDRSRLTSLSEDFSSHDLAQDAAGVTSLPVNGECPEKGMMKQDSGMTRDEGSVDSMTGMPRSETIIENCVGDASGSMCNMSPH